MRYTNRDHLGMWTQKWRQATLLLSFAGILTLLFAIVSTPTQAAQGASGDWSTYMANNGHSGFNRSETIINPKTAPHLKVKWVYHNGSNTSGSSTPYTGGTISAQPVEARGHIYWGSWDGYLHSTNLNGSQEWKTFVGRTTDTNPSCGYHHVGVVSTATVASLSINGTMTSVVFVGGGDASMYAINASTGSIIWRTNLGTSPSHFVWSSPVVYNGSVYTGIASFGDCPVVQGLLIQLNAKSGVTQHVFSVVRAGCTGGAIWGTPTIDEETGTLYIGTGNAGSCSTTEPLRVSFLALRASNLSLIGHWRTPASNLAFDEDFGTTPTLFSATIDGKVHKLVGLADKNGTFHAFDRNNVSAGPIWEDQVTVGGASPQKGTADISSAAWDGSTLYIAGGMTKVKGQKCQGSVRGVNPVNGTYLWQRCLNAPVLGSVTAVPGL